MQKGGRRMLRLADGHDCLQSPLFANRRFDPGQKGGQALKRVLRQPIQTRVIHRPRYGKET